MQAFPKFSSLSGAHVGIAQSARGAQVRNVVRKQPGGNMPTENNLPHSIELYGKRLEAIGRGKYPYECISKDKYPNAMIYHSREAGWTHEHSSCFLRRDQSKDRTE